MTYHTPSRRIVETLLDLLPNVDVVLNVFERRVFRKKSQNLLDLIFRGIHARACYRASSGDGYAAAWGYASGRHRYPDVPVRDRSRQEMSDRAHAKLVGASARTATRASGGARIRFRENVPPYVAD